MKHNKRKYFSKFKRLNHHLQKRIFSLYIIIKKVVVLKENIRNCGFFHYNIRADPLLSISYVVDRWISCSYSDYLSKMSSSGIRSQDKYNQVWYKGENKNCVYWPILGSYNNQQIIHCIDSRKQHESTETDMNVYINMAHVDSYGIT